MEETITESIRVFAEYLNNLRAVNLYVSVNSQDSECLPVLSVKSNEIEIPQLGQFKIILDELDIEDRSNISPRVLGNSSLCYRLVVKPNIGCGSATAEVVTNFARTVDEGAKNLVKNSINTVALQEGTRYQIKCRFCLKYLSEIVSFDRIRPLPSSDWVENAHELWYCHPPEQSQAQVVSEEVLAQLNKISLSQGQSNSDKPKSVVELLKCPDANYCFYGPCNWAVNKDIVKGIVRENQDNNYILSNANCSFCGHELGKFTSEFCVKIWDFGIVWMDHSRNEECDGLTSSKDVKERAEKNFKSIVFATIYDLSDTPTFRFTVCSTLLGNSVFLWNIDRNFCVYEPKTIAITKDSTSKDSTKLIRRKVAKFFFALKENNLLQITNKQELQIMEESEKNEQSILSIPDYVYKAGVEALKAKSVLYSRSKQSLQCGYLIYDV